MTAQKSKKAYYTLFVGPSTLIYASIIIFPVLFSLYLSFTKWNGIEPMSFVGLSQYTRMFTDPVFLHGLRNNLLIVAVSIFGQLPLGFIIAYILYRKMVGARSFFETMIFLPITISAIVVALLWAQIFSPTGLWTALIRNISGNPRYIIEIFQDKQLAMIPVLFVILWMYTGMYMVIFLASMQKISPSVLESAVIDGASERQIMFKIVTPSMINILFTTAVFAIAGSLKSFDLIFAMTSGGPAHYTEVIAIYMYTNTFKYYNYGFGSAISIVIVILSIGLITLAQKVYQYFENKFE